MTSPLSRIRTGSFFSGVMREYSSFCWPGATVTGVSSILSISPSSIAAMRTLRAKGEAGEKVSFIVKGPRTMLAMASWCFVGRHSGFASSRRPGMTAEMAVRCRLTSRRNDLLALLAEAFDAERHDVADIEILRRLHAGADARRRAGGEHVAGQERHELRDIGDAFGNREDHGRGRAGLLALAVDVEPHRQALRVRDFVPGDEPGPERAEGVVRLAQIGRASC